MIQVNSPSNHPTTAVFHSHSPEETEALGEKIGAALKAGNVVAMRGGLGAGKTTLVKGLARSLGVEEDVTSPTYTIISEYAGRLPLYHMDAYRLEGDDDFAGTGAGEYLAGNGVSVVEWSEKLKCSLPAGSIVIEITPAEDGGRNIAVSGLEADF